MIGNTQQLQEGTPAIQSGAFDRQVLELTEPIGNGHKLFIFGHKNPQWNNCALFYPPKTNTNFFKGVGETGMEINDEASTSITVSQLTTVKKH